MYPRPTLRCLRDLNIKPSYDILLHDIDHPLIKNAIQNVKHITSVPRIRGIDDRVFYKCKVREPDVRGALWMHSNNVEAWILSAGKRDGKNKNDFYETLVRDCKNKAKLLKIQVPSYNKKTYTDHLLPTNDDKNRLIIDEKLFYSREKKIEAAEAFKTAKVQQGKPVRFEYDNYVCYIQIDYDNGADKLEVRIEYDNYVEHDFFKKITKLLIPDYSFELWEIVYANKLNKSSAIRTYIFE